MVAIPLQTLEELEISAEEFERLVDLGLELSDHPRHELRGHRSGASAGRSERA